MSITLSEQMQLSVDVSVLLKKRPGETLPHAEIDRELVDLLIAVRDTGSVQEACDQLCLSIRNAQRTMKRFVDRSGIELLRHRGAQGTELTEEGHQCIALYVAARYCVSQVVKEHMLPRPLPPLSNYPTTEDWNHRNI